MAQKRRFILDTFVLKFMIDFFISCNQILLGAHVLAYYRENKKGTHKPHTYNTQTLISKTKIEYLQSTSVFCNDPISFIDARTIASHCQRKRIAQKKNEIIIHGFIEKSFHWIMDQLHHPKLWRYIPEQLQSSIINSLVLYVYNHPFAYKFDYYQSQDKNREHQEMSYLSIIHNSCHETGIISKEFIWITHTLARYGITHLSQKEAINYTTLAHDYSKQINDLPKKLRLGIMKSMMYLRCRGEGWLKEYDKKEQQNYYLDALECTSNDLERASIKRLEAECMLSFSGGYYQENMKKLLDDSFRYFHSYEKEDTHYWQFQTAQAMYTYYSLGEEYLALPLFERIKDSIIKTQGEAWNHQLLGSVALHADMCRREIGLESIDHDRNLIKGMYEQCNFDQYYQFCSPKRRATLLSI